MFHWICPACSQPLTPEDNRWHCPQGHSFDVAKSGYINLLLAQHKSSKQPGDDKAMLQARREFLNAGHYQPIAEALGRQLNALFPEANSNAAAKTLLDCGCGEGYYLQQLTNNLHSHWEFAGVDIAKAGVELAAKRNANIHWVCASNARLPLEEHSIDVVLRIFTPEQDVEAQRVLKKSGYLIVIGPAEHHLQGIKQQLYDHVKPYGQSTTPAGFELVTQAEVAYELQLTNNSAIQQLFAMTPFNWRGKREVRQQLLAADALSTQIHVVINCYKPLFD